MIVALYQEHAELSGPNFSESVLSGSPEWVRLELLHAPTCRDFE
jgi:hypothetical protein